MKLVLCRKCSGIFSVGVDMKSCSCNSSKGKYTDNNCVELETHGSNIMVVELDDDSMRHAVSMIENNELLSIGLYAYPMTCQKRVNRRING